MQLLTHPSIHNVIKAHYLCVCIFVCLCTCVIYFFIYFFLRGALKTGVKKNASVDILIFCLLRI